MNLVQLSISKFKCFDSITIKNLSSINIFIGKNNSGKSSILEALSYFRQNANIPKELWKLSDKPQPPGITAIFRLSEKEEEKLLNKLPYDKNPQYMNFRTHLKETYGEPLKIKETFTPDKSGSQINIFEFCLSKESGQEFMLVKQAHSRGYNIRAVESELNSMGFFVDATFPKPQFIKCDSSRKIDEINDPLFTLKTSRSARQNDIIQEIQGIVQRITPDKLHFDIYRETKEGKDFHEVSFTTHEKRNERIRLKFGGKGNEELIYLVFNIIQNRGKIIGIEEPEIQMHPELQKRFFEFIKEEAETHKSTFFITTHSNIFLNENEEGSSYLMKLISDKTSQCEQIEQKKIMSALEEIGLTFSDFYLANGMLFVEGKEDKEAIKKWSIGLLNKDIESKGIKIIIMQGARNAKYFAESEVLKNFSNLPIKAPFLILIDRDEKSENDIKKLRKNFGKNIRVLNKREFENYLVTKEILKEYIKKEYSDYFSSKKKSELNSHIEEKLEQSCEQLKKLALILNFLKNLSDDLYIHSVKIFSRYKSEAIWKLIKDKDIEKLFPFVIEGIVGKDILKNIFSNDFKEKYCKKIWEAEKNSFNKDWRKWKLSEKLSAVPGKELIKVIREKIDIPNFQISEKLLIDFISKNTNLIPKEFQRIIKYFFLNNVQITKSASL